MEIRVVAVLAVAMRSLLNLSHLSNPLEQSQLVKRLLQFPMHAPGTTVNLFDFAGHRRDG